MPDPSWTENQTDEDLDPLGSLLDWSDPEDEFRSDFFEGFAGRRKKAAFALSVIWVVTIGLHLVSWGIWAVWGLTGLLCVQSLRFVLAKPAKSPQILADDGLAQAPRVALLVAAHNEERVIADLVHNLCDLDYPQDKYEVWVIDDRSTDRTPQMLSQLAQQYPQLKTLRRTAGDTGGKSGALNQVLPLTRGEIIGVFDADAKVPQNVLRHVLSRFTDEQIGAVQMRKAITNADENFWTRGQMAEMSLDSYIQSQRIALGGIGELRGNGQFVRRQALEQCGGWNEQTITDDLDLTLRLHLDRWQIDLLWEPPVLEEGVTRIMSLWHQRNRWAEGGYQRYLDYWRWILSDRLGFNKRIDLLFFMLMQYLLPTAALPDCLMSILRHRLPLLGPLTVLMFSVSCWGMVRGLRQTNFEMANKRADSFSLFFKSLRGMVYMLHWLAIVPSITARMSVRQKRLKWVKTVHEGIDVFSS